MFKNYERQERLGKPEVFNRNAYLVEIVTQYEERFLQAYRAAKITSGTDQKRAVKELILVLEEWIMRFSPQLQEQKIKKSDIKQAGGKNDYEVVKKKLDEIEELHQESIDDAVKQNNKTRYKEITEKAHITFLILRKSHNEMGHDESKSTNPRFAWRYE